MNSFYADTVASLPIDRDSSILVVCGGCVDRDVFLGLNFSNVTISNMDGEEINGKEDAVAPFKWIYQDAEQLSLPDESFDFVVVHAGLHHCGSPHRALLEMYRVARRGILAFEARDSFLMKVSKRLGLVPDYELSAVRAHNMVSGGQRNSCVPNYVYRWNENEVRKTIYSYAPHSPHDIGFFYGLNIPDGRLPFENSASMKWLPSLFKSAMRILSAALPKQRNLFAFYISKPRPDRTFPWLKGRNEFNPTYSGIGSYTS
jgi:SAM-dependent methyltransferase